MVFVHKRFDGFTFICTQVILRTIIHIRLHTNDAGDLKF